MSNQVYIEKYQYNIKYMTIYIKNSQAKQMRISKNNLMHIMVSILIYIVGSKCIHRIIKCQVEQVIDVILAKHRDNMGKSEDCIDVNNHRALRDGIDNPHASILVQ